MEKNGNRDFLSLFNRHMPGIEAALKHAGGTHEPIDVLVDLYQCHKQFWHEGDTCVITEIITYPRKRVLHVFLAAGKLTEILALEPVITEWAKAQGCESKTIQGRKGWDRVLPKHGWKTTSTLLERKI